MPSAADPSTNNTDKEVASKATLSLSVLATHASGSFNSEQAFDYDCARLQRLAQGVSSFVGLRMDWQEYFVSKKLWKLSI